MSTEWNPGPPGFSGRLLVVAGQCSKVGKTALIGELISNLPQFSWTAVKITPHFETGSTVKAVEMVWPFGRQAFVICEDRDPTTETDTGRFLTAGAARAIWVQTKGGRLKECLPSLAAKLGTCQHIVVESNAILEFWRPNLMLMVLDPSNPDFKESAERAFGLADAFVLRSPFPVCDANSRWSSLGYRPRFLQLLGQPLPAALQDLARQSSSSPR